MAIVGFIFLNGGRPGRPERQRALAGRKMRSGSRSRAGLSRSRRRRLSPICGLALTTGPIKIFEGTVDQAHELSGKEIWAIGHATFVLRRNARSKFTGQCGCTRKRGIKDEDAERWCRSSAASTASYEPIKRECRASTTSKSRHGKDLSAELAAIKQRVNELGNPYISLAKPRIAHRVEGMLTSVSD